MWVARKVYGLRNRALLHRIWDKFGAKQIKQGDHSIMRKLAFSLLAVAVLASVSLAADSKAAGKAQTMSGYISDEKCGARGVNMVDCVKKCAAEGKKLVFVSDKDHEVTPITNQEILKGHEGEHVTITAKDVKGSLQISKIEAAK
jgi:hypothetical protein